MTPLAGVGLICVLFAKKYTLIRNFVKESDQKSGGSGDGSGGNANAVTDAAEDVSDAKGAEKEEGTSPPS